ncbi:MAG TPA: CAP domain-containing protein [Mycobacteriales bacterium]
MIKQLRRLVAVAAATGALSAAAVLVPAQAEAFTSVNGVRLNSFEARITSLINGARTSRGLVPLTVASGTTDLARRWSMNQAAKNLLYHNPSLVSQIVGYGSSSWRQVAENVGRGYGADSLFTAYMNSPGHRANILDPDMRFLGIGWVERPDGSGYNTQVFVDSYSSSYGRSREPAAGALGDNRTPTSNLNIGSFENGWDPRVFVGRSGYGVAVAGPYFEAPALGDQGVRFSFRETAVSTGGGAEIRVRDALDLRNARALAVRLAASSGSHRAVTVDVTLRRELGSSILLGRVTVPHGGTVNALLAIPSSARNFRNLVGFAVTRSSMEALSSSLSGRYGSVRVADVVVVV